MKKLTEKQKQKMRVAVAKDVIKRIQLEKLTGATGKYIEDKNLSSKSYHSPDQAEKNCSVCAIGAVFLSYVRLYNGINRPLNYNYGADMYHILNECFLYKQLADIDNYFEFEEHWVIHGASNDTDRILMIMQNIVDHKGTFKSNVKYEIVME